MMINDRMKTLTIEHLAAYLPYGLKFISGHYLVGVYGGGSDITRPILLSETMSGQIDWEANMDMDKPLLRPLSQLTETIEHNGERFVPLDWINENTPIKAVMCKGTNGKVGLFCDNIGASHYNAWPYSLVRMLLSMHFDVFDLLQYDLAIPIPSIPQP